MTDELITELLGRRRDRAIAAILGVKEREVDKHLPPATQRLLRKVVLDQLNDFTAMVGDILASMGTDNSVILNEYYLRKIAEIHEVVVANGAR